MINLHLHQGWKVFFLFFFSIFISASLPVENQVKKDTPWLPKRTLLQNWNQLLKKNPIPVTAPSPQPNPVPSRINFLKAYFLRGESPEGGARRAQALFILGAQKEEAKQVISEEVLTAILFSESHVIARLLA